MEDLILSESFDFQLVILGLLVLIAVFVIIKGD